MSYWFRRPASNQHITKKQVLSWVDQLWTSLSEHESYRKKSLRLFLIASRTWLDTSSASLWRLYNISAIGTFNSIMLELGRKSKTRNVYNVCMFHVKSCFSEIRKTIMKCITVGCCTDPDLRKNGSQQFLKHVFPIKIKSADVFRETWWLAIVKQLTKRSISQICWLITYSCYCRKVSTIVLTSKHDPFLIIS